MWPEKKPETNSYIYRIFILIYLHLDLTDSVCVRLCVREYEFK